MTCRDTKLPEKVGQGSAVAILSRELFLIRFSLTSASRDFRLGVFRLVSLPPRVRLVDLLRPAS
jgi:hypothetical protein